ncbi:MAG: carbamoyl phosphate synthase large subunit, partial [Proteobacteria bacterium]|nr:carbamoyl phosphate synthase large subunit [Pseudomonadota bacterium]
NSEDQDERVKILKARLEVADPIRLLLIAQSFREGISLEEVHKITHYEPWFLEQIKKLVDVEEEVKRNGLPKDKEGLLFLKKLGFSDKRLAKLSKLDENEIYQIRHKLGVKPVYKRVDSCAGEFDSTTSYMYSCYES